MSYSIFPEIVELSYTYDKLVSGSTTTYYYYDLDSVRRIADALGDGFYADMVSNDEGIPLYFTSNTNQILVDGSKSLPVLRHQKYGNVCIMFTLGVSWYKHQVYISVFDPVKREPLFCCFVHSNYGGSQSNDTANASVRVVNVSSTRKMICANDTLYGYGAVILGDYIIGNQATLNSSSSGDYLKISCVSSDGDIYTTNYRSTIEDSDCVQLMPFFAAGFPDEIFKGVYVLYRTNRHRESSISAYEGTRYFIPGFNEQNSGTNLAPILVISDER